MSDQPGPASLGERIKFQREHHGWSQRQLAMRAGINNSIISRLEDGTRTDIYQSVLAKIADALGVEDTYLTGRSRGEPGSPQYSPEGVLILTDTTRLPVPTLRLEDR
jgi:transcriptional regulator with XRE-family HTH domain